MARVGDKYLVVVDGEEGKEYDGILTIGGGAIIFDFPDGYPLPCNEKCSNLSGGGEDKVK